VQFVDTNILLYAISRDPAEQDKAKRANDILAGRELALSVQVLQEFYVQATRPADRTPSRTTRPSGSSSPSGASPSRTSPAGSW
jgi:predicted nucleic acid-binding protein